MHRGHVEAGVEFVPPPVRLQIKAHIALIDHAFLFIGLSSGDVVVVSGRNRNFRLEPPRAEAPPHLRIALALTVPHAHVAVATEIAAVFCPLGLGLRVSLTSAKRRKQAQRHAALPTSHSDPPPPPMRSTLCCDHNPEGVPAQPHVPLIAREPSL